MPSRHWPLQLLGLTAAFAIALPGVRAGASQNTTPVAVEGKAATSFASGPLSRAEGREALDAAVAAALLGTAQEQFRGQKMEVKLDTVDVTPISPRDREVSGRGLLRMVTAKPTQDDWLPFRYRVLYDTETTTAGLPNMTLGASDGGEQVRKDSPLARTLLSEAQQSLAQEFPGQPARLQLDRLTRQPMGKRWERVTGQGTVAFGRRDRAEVQVEGLYDPAAKKWLRVTHELGTTANWEFTQPAVKTTGQTVTKPAP